MNRDGPLSHADSQDHFHPHTPDGHYRGGRDNHDVADSRDGEQRRPRVFHENDFQGGGRDRTSNQGYSATHRHESQGWGSVDNHDDIPQWGSPSSEWRKGEPEDDRSKNWENNRNKEHRSQGNRRWQSDNGWETRKRDRHQNRRPPDNQDDVDRSWEPGPNWHPRGDNGYRSQRGRGAPGKHLKGKKNNQNRQRQRGDKDRDHDRRWDRDRRNDNDTLNKYAQPLRLFLCCLIFFFALAGREESFTLYLPNQSAVLSSKLLLLPGHVQGPLILSTLDIRLGAARRRGPSHRSEVPNILALHSLVAGHHWKEQISQDLHLHRIGATRLGRLPVGEVCPLCLREAGAGAGAQAGVLGTDQGQSTDCHLPPPSGKFPSPYPRPPFSNVPIFSIKSLSRQNLRRLMLMGVTPYVLLTT